MQRQLTLQLHDQGGEVNRKNKNDIGF
uniref:Uncharacterized protein n=1 Tax=mine drainage metagenome TaxID=410659 RepID=E6QNS2_9ZZZZ